MRETFSAGITSRGEIQCTLARPHKARVPQVDQKDWLAGAAPSRLLMPPPNEADAVKSSYCIRIVTRSLPQCERHYVGDSVRGVAYRIATSGPASCRMRAIDPTTRLAFAQLARLLTITTEAAEATVHRGTAWIRRLRTTSWKACLMRSARSETCAPPYHLTIQRQNCWPILRDAGAGLGVLQPASRGRRDAEALQRGRVAVSASTSGEGGSGAGFSNSPLGVVLEVAASSDWKLTWPTSKRKWAAHAGAVFDLDKALFAYCRSSRKRTLSKLTARLQGMPRKA